MEGQAAEPVRILVVEDEPLLREVIVAELVDAGYGVTVAETGDEAMSALDPRARPDLLFTDIRLPGRVDGWTLAEMFRAVFPELPVIYATGYTVEPPRQVPGSIFLKKPYRPSILLDAVRRLVGPGPARPS